MSTETDVLENFSSFAKHIRLLKQHYRLSFSNNGVRASNDYLSLELTEADIHSLEDGHKPASKSLTYHEDCGLSFGFYSEFFVQLGHPEYLYLDTDEWPSHKPLKYMVGDTTVIIGKATPLFVALMEPIFLDSDFYPDGFSDLASIQLIGPTADDARPCVSKAMYYLNSHYLRPTGIYVRLRKLTFADFEDPLGLVFGENDFESMFAKVLRSRTRKRTDYATIEPILLYNYAAQASHIEQFLGFYRVLEFFMNRSAVATIDKLRRDPSVSSGDILRYAAAKNEESLLAQLVQHVLTPAQKKKLNYYLSLHGLLKDSAPPALAKTLYAFRNSVIHAKEGELARILVPDPFKESESLAKWIYVARFIAERSIKVLNS